MDSATPAHEMRLSASKTKTACPIACQRVRLRTCHSRKGKRYRLDGAFEALGAGQRLVFQTSSRKPRDVTGLLHGLIEQSCPRDQRFSLSAAAPVASVGPLVGGDRIRCTLCCLPVFVFIRHVFFFCPASRGASRGERAPLARRRAAFWGAPKNLAPWSISVRNEKPKGGVGQSRGLPRPREKGQVGKESGRENHIGQQEEIITRCPRGAGWRFLRNSVEHFQEILESYQVEDQGSEGGR